jgi:hypothetical protein
MSDPDFAALDPIFYLHHSNIDRIWADVYPIEDILAEINGRTGRRLELHPFGKDPFWENSCACFKLHEKFAAPETSLPLWCVYRPRLCDPLRRFLTYFGLEVIRHGSR